MTVATEPELDDVVERMVAADWEVRPPRRDHPVPGLPTDDVQWVKRLLVEPMYRRRVNLHVRVPGRANQRYALLFRDYLRSHPETAAAYGEFKRRAAALPIESVGGLRRSEGPGLRPHLPARGRVGRAHWLDSLTNRARRRRVSAVLLRGR